MRLHRASLLALSLASTSLACSSSNDAAPAADGGASDATTAPDASFDAGTHDAAPPREASAVDAPTSDGANEDDAATVHPADTSAAARYPRLGLIDPAAVVLTAPSIVTVSFAAMSASARALAESFDDGITTTPWWTTVTKGYCAPEGSATCVGPGTSGGHVTLNETAAATYTDSPQLADASTLRDFLLARVASGVLPAPTPQTIYMLYLPSTSTVTFSGMTSCASNGFMAYHNWLDVTPEGGAPIHAQYVVVPDCGEGNDVTLWASHELVETVTDPRPELSLGYAMADPGWYITYDGNNEIADLCVGATTTEGSWSVQRIFSNDTAAAGHSSCAPLPTGQVFFSAATSKQLVQLAVGASTTLDVTGYADGPLAEWTLSADDMNVIKGGSPYLELSLDDTRMYAGKTVKLTITLKSPPPLVPPNQGYAAYVIRSHSPDGQTVHIWPAAVQMN